MRGWDRGGVIIVSREEMDVADAADFSFSFGRSFNVFTGTAVPEKGGDGKSA